jgi:hypothetical protein
LKGLTDLPKGFIPQTSWEFNTLGIYDFTKPGPYQYIFNFLREHQSKLNGDILEAGTYRGKTALSMGLYLNKHNLGGVIHGFDTFAGFPSYSTNDLPEKFQELYELNLITNDHFFRVQRLRLIQEEMLKQDFHPAKTSSSGDFSNNSIESLYAKIDFLDLSNILLHVGPFETTMKQEAAQGLRFSMIFLDCDLYDGYMETLRYGWEKLIPGGIVFLDEYYSLKFPGARIAVNEFFADKKDFELNQISDTSIDDFERWVVRKLDLV